MDSQDSKKRLHYPKRKHFCSSCHEEIGHHMGGLCKNCQKKYEVIKKNILTHDGAIDQGLLMFKEDSDELFSPNENNSVYDIIEAFKLLLYNDGNNLSNSLNHERELVSFCKNVLNSASSIQVFFYFCKHGAATSQVLQVQLSMKYQTVYRVIKDLSNLGIIFPSQKIRNHAKSKGGPRFEVWSLKGADGADVAECIKLHRRCMSPKYRLAEEILPTILDDFIYKRNVKEVTKRELIKYVKSVKLVSFNAHDIVEMAIPMIQSKGIKVWR